MKTFPHLFFPLFAIPFLVSTAHAEGEFPAVSNVSSYMAEKPDLPVPTSVKYTFLEGVYFSGTAGAVRSTVKGESSPDVTGLTKTNKRKTIGQGGAGIGFLFRESGLFNRISLDYLVRSKTPYTADFVFNGGASSVNATVKSQSLLAKVYSDINLGHRIMPYVVVGAGGYYNKAKGIITTGGTTTALTNATTKRHSTGFAWGAGGGVRFRLNRQVMVDVGYEYDYLGKVNAWVVPSTTGGAAGTLRANRIYSHSANVSFMLQPWGTYPEENL